VAKFTALEADTGLGLDGARWRECRTDWTAPFRPEEASWYDHPAVSDVIPWHNSGVKTNRTWTIAPDEQTLERRWNRLASAAPADKDRLFKATRDRDTSRMFPGLPPIAKENRAPDVSRFAYRSFDRQYVINDVRFGDFLRPSLWESGGGRQVYTVMQHTNTLASGPGLVFSSLVPDMDCFQGHHGGRVLPLYRGPDGSSPNLAPGLLPHLTARLGTEVSAEDLLAYLAAIASHPGYTEAFREQLKTPGIRIPLTADPGLWAEAVELGAEVVWLHTYGERFCDPSRDRPTRTPRLPAPRRPEVRVEIPDRPGHLPDRIWHDSDEGDHGQRLHVGEGVIAPVSDAVWRYDVGGMRVVRKWFASRERTPVGKRRGSPLDDIRPERWTPRFTDDLLHLITVLTRLVDLEPCQRGLLDRVLNAPLITTGDLAGARVLPIEPGVRKAPRTGGQGELPLA
jgi:hypothetical protein